MFLKNFFQIGGSLVISINAEIKEKIGILYLSCLYLYSFFSLKLKIKYTFNLNRLYLRKSRCSKALKVVSFIKICIHLRTWNCNIFLYRNNQFQRFFISPAVKLKTKFLVEENGASPIKITSFLKSIRFKTYTFMQKSGSF